MTITDAHLARFSAVRRSPEMKRTSLIMHACNRCGGAAYLEDPREEEWRCLQCARTINVSQDAAKKARTAA
jgi:uncharacterized membrane protein